MLPLHITLPQGVATWLFMLVCVAFGAGCALTPCKAYNGLEQPISELVIIQNSSKFAFLSFVKLWSVNDQRVQPCPPDILHRSSSVAVLPGAHWYQVEVARRSKVAMLFFHDYFYCEEICGFRLEAAPGTAYELVEVDNGDLDPANGRKVYRASLKIKERFAEQKPIVRHIPVECASWDLFALSWFKFNRDVFAKEGFLCRGYEDCLPGRANCIQENGYLYGICAKPW